MCRRVDVPVVLRIESRAGSRLHSLDDVLPDIRPVQSSEIDRIVDIALRAWAPVHASIADVLGAGLNHRVYPDWAASQATDVRDACADPDVQVFVATDGSEVLGFVAIRVDAAGGSGEVDMIAVDPRRQRRGVGRGLAERALKVMREQGCTLVHVATGGDAGHAPARALYDAAGFTALPLVRYYREI